MSNYSQIINAENYNRIITEEHLYIAESDQYIYNYIYNLAKIKQQKVVELGCGPARILRNIVKIPNIILNAVELDSNFLSYAQEITKDYNINYINCSLEHYKSDEKIDVFYSQGVHHHIAKGNLTESYLQNIYNNLADQGIYILSDEFIPDYESEALREVKITIWYSHIIADALNNGYNFLAKEEAKTFLDDIHEGRNLKLHKSDKHIELVLNHVNGIDQEAQKGNVNAAENKAQELLNLLNEIYDINNEIDLSLYLSRQDYKISHNILKIEIEKAGFNILEYKSFGPIENIGAMVVYILTK